MQGIVLSVGALAVSATLGAVALAKQETEPFKSILFAGAAIFIFVLIIVIPVRYVLRRK
jgi:nucleoside recognition membrane protein YjiH